MATVGDPLLENKFHQLLGRRAHVLKALAERYHGKTHALKVLYHLYSSPSVEGDLSDVVAFAKVLDELLDEAVVDHVSFGRL